jgi:hypothetical protein
MVAASAAFQMEVASLAVAVEIPERFRKKLNEIKAKHANVNVYLNTLVDEAISFYYEALFSRNAKSIPII